MAEKNRIGKAQAETLLVKHDTTIGGNLVVKGNITSDETSANAAGAAVTKVAKVALTAVDTAGGIFAWENPEPGAILVKRVVIDVTTAATAACSISVGQAANGTTSAANLIDTLDVHTAAGTFDNISNPGSGGHPFQRVAATAFVTGSKASGASAGLVGSAYIEYITL